MKLRDYRIVESKFHETKNVWQRKLVWQSFPEPHCAYANVDICIVQASRGWKRVKHFLIRRLEKGENTCRGTRCAIPRCRKNFVARVPRFWSCSTLKKHDEQEASWSNNNSFVVTAVLPRASRYNAVVFPLIGHPLLHDSIVAVALTNEELFAYHVYVQLFSYV